jgi:glycosyltransferase involved in cell wall biosynthesis
LADTDKSSRSTSTRLKVLLAVTETLGGAGVHTYQLAKGLDKEKFDITVVFGPKEPLAGKFQGLGVRLKHVCMSRGLSPLKNTAALFQIYRIMREGRFDIVIAGGSMAGFLCRLAGAFVGKPICVFVIHQYASHRYLNAASRTIYLDIERMLDRLTDHYVAVSTATRNEGIRKGIFRDDKVTVIRNAIDLAEFDERRVTGNREKCGFCADDFIVGTIGRIEKQKGIEYFLRAMAVLSESIPSGKFLVVGEGPLRPEMERLARELGLGQKVTFTGWREDIADLLGCMDVFCLASLWEAFPFVLLEAFAMRKPVVATGVDGVPEVVEDGVTGILVPPEDPESLALGVLRIYRDPDLTRSYGDAGRRRIEELFPIERMVSSFESLILGLSHGSREVDA